MEPQERRGAGSTGSYAIKSADRVVLCLRGCPVFPKRPKSAGLWPLGSSKIWSRCRAEDPEDTPRCHRPLVHLPDTGTTVPVLLLDSDVGSRPEPAGCPRDTEPRPAPPAETGTTPKPLGTLGCLAVGLMPAVAPS